MVQPGSFNKSIDRIYDIRQMNVRQINANLLVALDALLETQSVSQAAHAIGLSQPAMSNSLTRLRELFGDPLLVRVGNQMQLTPRAQGLVEPVREGVAAFNRALSPPESFDPSKCRAAFRVVMSDLAELVLLPRLLRSLNEQAPQATLQVFGGGLFEVPSSLASGDLDLMLGYFQSAELGPGFRETDLWSSYLVCVARKGHPQVKMQDGRGRMTRRQYLNASHVIVTQRDQALGMVDILYPDLERRIGARVPRSVLVPALVAETDLIAALDVEIFSAFAETLAIQEVHVPIRMPKGIVGMLWHERTHYDPERRFLRELVKAARP